MISFPLYMLGERRDGEQTDLVAPRAGSGTVNNGARAWIAGHGDRSSFRAL